RTTKTVFVSFVRVEDMSSASSSRSRELFSLRKSPLISPVSNRKSACVCLPLRRISEAPRPLSVRLRGYYDIGCCSAPRGVIMYGGPEGPVLFSVARSIFLTHALDSL